MRQDPSDAVETLMQATLALDLIFCVSCLLFYGNLFIAILSKTSASDALTPPREGATVIFKMEHSSLLGLPIELREQVYQLMTAQRCDSNASRSTSISSTPVPRDESLVWYCFD